MKLLVHDLFSFFLLFVTFSDVELTLKIVASLSVIALNITAIHKYIKTKK